jgi:beta-lactamase class D
MNRLLIISCTLLVLLASCRDARIHEHKEWASIYEAEGVKEAGFILRDQTHDAVHYFNINQDTSHFVPASTFKIVLSLAALELGVVQDDKFIIPWNGEITNNPLWNKDMNLREAFEVSSEPYFKEVATRIGKERLQKFIDTLHYGNQKMGDSASTCWHDHSLMISADEQLGFMKRLYFNQLPFTERSQRIVRSLMLRENANNRKLYYKTGWSKSDEKSEILWVVGFAEYAVKVKEDKASMNKSDVRNYVYFFAQNFKIPSGETVEKWAPKRISLLNAVLTDYVSKSSK